MSQVFRPQLVKLHVQVPVWWCRLKVMSSHLGYWGNTQFWGQNMVNLSLNHGNFCPKTRVVPPHVPNMMMSLLGNVLTSGPALLIELKVAQIVWWGGDFPQQVSWLVAGKSLPREPPSPLGDWESYQSIFSWKVTLIFYQFPGET